MNSLEQRAAEIMEMGRSNGIKAIIALVQEAVDTVEAGYDAILAETKTYGGKSNVIREYTENVGIDPTTLKRFEQ